MATRSTRKSIPAGITIEPVEVHAAHEVNEPGFSERFQEAIGSWCANTTRRSIITFVASCIVGLAIGAAAAPIINALAVATLLVSGSSFLATIVFLLGFLLMGAVAYVAGGVVGAYVHSGKAEEHYAGAKRWVSGLFGRKTVGA